MTFGQLLVLYLMAGGGVAAAVYLSVAESRFAQRWFQIVTAAVFWPLYLPLLLSYRAESQTPKKNASQAASPADDLGAAIAQVDAELAGALGSLDGWANDIMAQEKARLQTLRAAWDAQAERIREMDRLLNSPEWPALAAGSDTNALSENVRNSRQAVRQNRDILRQVRERTYLELLDSMSHVRELVSMIHVAKFTGATSARAVELVAQIAAAGREMTR